LQSTMRGVSPRLSGTFTSLFAQTKINECLRKTESRETLTKMDNGKKGRQNQTEDRKTERGKRVRDETIWLVCEGLLKEPWRHHITELFGGTQTNGVRQGGTSEREETRERNWSERFQKVRSTAKRLPTKQQQKPSKSKQTGEETNNTYNMQHGLSLVVRSTDVHVGSLQQYLSESNFLCVNSMHERGGTVTVGCVNTCPS